MTIQNIKKEFLEKRGYSSEDELIKNPGKNDVKKLKNFDKWTDRLFQLLQEQKHITVFGDYDADGILATVAAYNGLKTIGFENVSYMQADRNIGYGFQEKYFKFIPEDTDCILMVDNGIGQKDAILKANSLGYETLVTDHHLQQEQNVFESPMNISLDPNSIGDEYPFKGLSGTALIWKVLYYFALKFDIPTAKQLLNNLDLVGISTLTDAMPVIDENRWYIEKALKLMNNADYCRPQWTAMRVDNNMNEFNTKDFGWKIGPLLNSVSRMHGKPDLAYKFMFCENKFKTRMIFHDLEDMNQERKEAVKVAARENKADGNVVFVNDGIQQSFAGLIASDFVKQNDRPYIVVVYNENEDAYMGSARSAQGFNLIEETKKDKYLIDELGFFIAGHGAAAGVKFPAKNKEEIAKRFTDIVSSYDFENSDINNYDFEMKDLTLDVFKQLNELEPFGYGLDAPVIRLSNYSIDNQFSISNAIKQKDKEFDLIWWNGEDVFLKNKLKHKKLTFIGDASINTFRGEEKLQFSVSKYIEEKTNLDLLSEEIDENLF